MAPITKLTRKTKTFLWTEECQKAWELVKHKYIEASILISANWEVEFHVHTNASLLVEGAMLSQNVTRKNDQLVMYVYRLLNRIKYNYSTTKRKDLAMVFSLHKFKHYILGNKFVFYVYHMTMVYLVNKPKVLGITVRWLLLFLEYDFIIMYKPCRTNVVAYALSRLLNITKPIGVLDQTIIAKLEWSKDVKEFLKTGQIEGTLSIQ
jgi:hypothetical protein